MEDLDESQTSCALDMRGEQKVKKISTDWKSKKGTKEFGGITSSSSNLKEEEGREMALQRAQMMEKVKRKIKEEEEIVLEEARRVMQERVDMVIKKEESELLADTRAKLSNSKIKQMKFETETEVDSRRKKLKADIDEERNQMVDKERAKMHDRVIKQIQEEHAAEIVQRKTNMYNERIQMEVGESLMEREQLRKTQEENKSNDGNEHSLPLNFQLDEKPKELDEQHLFLDSLGSKLQDSKDSTLHSDLYRYSMNERREFAQHVNLKLKLEELHLHDELKKKMVIRVRHAICDLERRMFEEEHQLAKIRLCNMINELYKRLIQDVEIQLLQEKHPSLMDTSEDIHKRCGSFQALEIPVVTSLYDSIASKEWRCEDDKRTSVEVERIWSNSENFHKIQVDKLETVEDISSKVYPKGSFCKLRSSFSSDNSILPSTQWSIGPQSEEEKNIKVENLWSQSGSSRTSKVATDKLKTNDVSLDRTSDLKTEKIGTEESFKDLIERLKNELKNEFLSLGGDKEVAHFPSTKSQQSSTILDLSHVFPSSIEEWRSEVGKEIRDLVQHYRNELEDKFHILKDEVKQELNIFLSHKDMTTENSRRTEQESRTKLAIHETTNQCQQLVSSPGFANTITQQHESSDKYIGQVQASGTRTSNIVATKERDKNTFQLIEDTNSNFTSNHTQVYSHHERSSTSGKKLGELDMLDLEDAIASFRQNRETPNIEVSSGDQTTQKQFEQQRIPTRELVMAQTFEDNEGIESKGFKPELLQLTSQPWSLNIASELEEVEDSGPGFITLEFATPRADEFILQGMQIGSNHYRCDSNCKHSHSKSYNEISPTVWHV